MVIGLRAFSDGFAYVILDGTQNAPTVAAKERLSLPKTASWPEALSWVRKQIEEISELRDPKSACIKIIESNARKKSPRRFQIEAILQEYLFTERSITTTTRIKSQIKRDISGFHDPARYLERVLSGFSALSKLDTPQYREATLVAVAELPEG